METSKGWMEKIENYQSMDDDLMDKDGN